VPRSSNLSSEDLKAVCKRCTNLEQLTLEACRGLDEEVFQHLQFAEGLQSLGLRSFRQSFGKLRLLGSNTRLQSLDLEGSMITDL
jgi:hypothetical protein